MAYSFHSGFVALGAGLAVGVGGLAAGYAIGIVGDYVRIFETPPQIYNLYSIKSVLEVMPAKLDYSLPWC